MKLIKTKVVHSQSKSAWNVIGTTLGAKYKIARVPYVQGINGERKEALDHAEFISWCFNNADEINNIKK
jgi:intein-encoded DNA endonuclease-like protein